MMMIAFYKTNWLSWIFIVLAQRINSPRLDMSTHSDTLSWLQTNQSLLSPCSRQYIQGNEKYSLEYIDVLKYI
jgi:hypothetical protein